jgi:SPP1 family predicted phage head-tail adaptor
MARQTNAAQLRERVTIERPVTTRNSLGEEVPAWETHAEVWAARLPVRGREWMAAAQTQTGTEVRFLVRWQSGILPTMRVVHNGVAHAIVGEPIDVDGRRTTLEIMCSSGVRDGR